MTINIGKALEVQSRALQKAPILPIEEVSDRPLSRARDNDTKYLDGLRGLACLLVYFHHHTFRSHALSNGFHILTNSYSRSTNNFGATLPVLRLLFSGGPTAVSIFFVISGYVLAVKPLVYSHSRESHPVLEAIASGMFRRWFRLFLPVAITTLLWGLSWHIFDIMPTSRASSIIGEVVNWARGFARYSFLFKDVENTYNDHVWSIAFEFRGSMVVYAAILGTSQMTTIARICTEASLITYFLWIVDGPYYACFVAGLLIRDLQLLGAVGPRVGQHLRISENTSRWAARSLFLFGLYLGGVPSEQETIPYLRSSPGWYLLSFLAPTNFAVFYHFWSAVLLVAATPHLTTFRRVLDSRVCQYLGRISFSLYLVHGPLLSSIGDRAYAALGRLSSGQADIPSYWFSSSTAKIGLYGAEIDYVAAQMFLLPLTLIVAELCTVLIDQPSLRSSWSLYRRTTR